MHEENLHVHLQCSADWALVDNLLLSRPFVLNIFSKKCNYRCHVFIRDCACHRIRSFSVNVFDRYRVFITSLAVIKNIRSLFMYMRGSQSSLSDVNVNHQQ